MVNSQELLRLTWYVDMSIVNRFIKTLFDTPLFYFVSTTINRFTGIYLVPGITTMIYVNLCKTLPKVVSHIFMSTTADQVDEAAARAGMAPRRFQDEAGDWL